MSEPASSVAGPRLGLLILFSWRFWGKKYKNLRDDALTLNDRRLKVGVLNAGVIPLANLAPLNRNPKINILCGFQGPHGTALTTGFRIFLRSLRLREPQWDKVSIVLQRLERMRWANPCNPER